ncbi:hypothetical protein SEA_CEN1621_54 [Microbacterium phage Cen1621]|uniref:Uncharacterized protein n=1 Tax=Microbacterium phage Cen1621 TaxID=2965191 RepID=A0A9E7QAJ6_9CAUD|nr:hypothetical protein SEA_CEN1621_54 [Microbacterium phage Cen1621]
MVRPTLPEGGRHGRSPLRLALRGRRPRQGDERLVAVVDRLGDLRLQRRPRRRGRLRRRARGHPRRSPGRVGGRARAARRLAGARGRRGRHARRAPPGGGRVSRSAVVEADLAEGDVPTRTALLCQHGREGFCHDDATPEERAAVAFLYEHAFAYALPALGQDEAEGYASWLLADSWHPGALVLAGSHERDLARYRELTGL